MNCVNTNLFLKEYLPMNMPQIVNERLSDKVVHQILQMVKDGQLKAGDKLPNETELSEQLNVSRGILREALISLQCQGFIRRKPKDGTYLTEDAQQLLLSQGVRDSIKRATVADLLDFRSALEQRVVERAIERASDEELAELMQILNESDASNSDNVGYYFHYKLAEVSQNPFYMNFIETYYDLIREFADKSRNNQERSEQVKQEHLAIAQAVCRRNKKAASEAVRIHFENADKNNF